MSNVYDIDHERKRRKQRAVEASTWIAKMDRGLADSEADALRAWMRADAGNRAELLEMARMWDKMDTLALLSGVSPHMDTLALLSEVSPHRARWSVPRSGAGR